MVCTPHTVQTLRLITRIYGMALLAHHDDQQLGSFFTENTLMILDMITVYKPWAKSNDSKQLSPLPGLAAFCLIINGDIHTWFPSCPSYGQFGMHTWLHTPVHVMHRLDSDLTTSLVHNSCPHSVSSSWSSNILVTDCSLRLKLSHYNIIVLQQRARTS